MSIIRPLELPKAPLRLKRKDGEVYVRCVIRNKDLVMTPEEWVRQHVIHFLINEKGISKGRIASELALNYNGRLKRADIVVFDAFGAPEMIVECKAPDIKISEKTLYQIAQYNSELNVRRLMLTNGLKHMYCKIDQEITFSEDWVD